MDDLTGFELPQTVQFAHRFGPNSEHITFLNDMQKNQTGTIKLRRRSIHIL